MENVVNPEDYSWILPAGLENVGKMSDARIKVRFDYTGDYEIKTAPARSFLSAPGTDG